ncbi:hypothetical protein PIB30_060365 [Stylosanthes scabra]|uniref:Uncharacterized protein n=1 Tax=Stylosanthes scabra TaxID=79078 RepID=A0ABU6SKX4_9FABA|nr:hypothetical protein [Stylosanthes scabra]
MKQTGGEPAKHSDAQVSESCMEARPYSVVEEKSCYLLSLLGTPDRFGSSRSGQSSFLTDGPRHLSGLTQEMDPMSSTTSCGPFLVTGRSYPTCLHKLDILAACGLNGSDPPSVLFGQ